MDEVQFGENKKKLNVILITGMLVFSFGTFTLDSFISSPRVKVFYLITTMFIFIIYYLLYNKLITIYKSEILWLLFICYFILNSLYLENINKTFLIDIIVFFMLFFYLLLVKVDIKYHRIVILVMLALSTIYALSSVFQFLNMDLYSKLILPYFTESQKEEVLRLYGNGSYTGFTRQTAYISGYLTFGLGIALLTINKFKGGVFQAIIIAIVPLLTFALFLGGKRAHVLFTIIALIITYLFSTKVKKLFLQLLKILTWAMFLFITTIIIFSFYTPDRESQFGKVYYRFENTFTSFLQGEDISSGRLILYEKALKLFYENPILGIGWREFKELTYGLLTSSSGSHPHNIYLQLITELGLIGFILFIVPVIYMYIKTIKYLLNVDILLQFDEWWKVGLQFSLFVQSFFLLYGLTGNLLTDHMYILMYIFASAITLSAVKQSKSTTNHLVAKG